MEQLRFKGIFVYAIILPFMLVLISPLTFYLSNHQEYALNLNIVLHFLVPLFAILSFILLVFLLASYHFPLIYKFLSALLVGLALAVWLQSQLFIWNFGFLDGKAIDWNSWSTQVKIEWISWAFILMAALYFSIKSPKKLLLGAQTGIVLGALTFFATWFSSYYQGHTADDKALDTLFSFHKENNKIVIILDTFQSDAFNEIVQNWPGEVGFLKGFTFYPNTIGGFPTTKASIPLILTGKFYKNEIPFDDWLTANYKQQNLPDYFKGLGYNANLASFIPTLMTGINATKVHLSEVGDANWLGIHKHQLLVLDTGLFKALPITLKPHIYNNGHWLLSSFASSNNEISPSVNAEDLQFLKSFERQSRVNSTAKGEFKFYHYSGVHLPDEIDETFKINYTMPSSRESYVRHARGVLLFLQRKFAQLKRLGIYDSAEIIVVGDHGRDLLPADLTDGSAYSDKVSAHVLGSARPLFLYKPAKANSNTPLQLSNAPRHLADIVCIFSQGSSVFGCDNSQLDQEMRPRQFQFYVWSHEDWERTYFPPMNSYLIEGDARNTASWRKQEIEYSAGEVKKLENFTPYTIGDQIRFDNKGNSQNYLWGGWAGQEAEMRWTEGGQSRLILKLNQIPNESLVLRLYGGPAPSKDEKFQQIRVLINNQEMIAWQVDHLGWYETNLETGLIKDGILDIRFLIAKPVAPCEISNSGDCRKLGLAVMNIIIDRQKDDHSLASKQG